MTSTEKLAGWGGHAGVEMRVVAPSDLAALQANELPATDLIARGLGRSYGDAAQRKGGTALDTTACARAEWTDRAAGLVRADAGVTIGDLIAFGIPAGFFVPVSPGTRNVTVGGAIAADIHGKNHHVDGSFGEHVRSMRMRLADNSVVEVSPTANAELFWATVGGMGLTGIILDADIAMAPVTSSLIQVETSRLETLDELMTAMRASDHEHAFSVAWVDLIGRSRSVLTQGSFAEPADIEPHVAGPLRRPGTPAAALPPLPPMRFVMRPAVKAFNELWWRRAPAEPTVTHESITAFFHPLDAIRNWNRLYGPNGFVQWQCVIPDDQDDALREICAQFKKHPAFFTVLKRFGPGNPAPLSFPMPGWTLAVDLPATNAVLDELHRFDELVVQAGGRLYLAKDARMRPEVLEAGYPRLDEWRAMRNAVDPGRRFNSDLAIRLGL